MKYSLIFFVILIHATSPASAHQNHAHDTLKPVKDWNFHPQYTLTGSAKNPPKNVPSHPRNPAFFLKKTPDAFSLLGESATQHYWELANAEELPKGPFTLELWMVYHVDRPIGITINQVSDGNQTSVDHLDWSLGYYGNHVFFSSDENNTAKKSVNLHFEDKKHYRISNAGYKENWHHIVGSYDGKTLTLYHNGDKKGQQEVGVLATPAHKSRLEATAYLNNEDYMQIGNTLNTLALYEGGITEDQAKQLFHKRKRLIDDGHLYDKGFHFTAGPYLNAVSENGVRMLWETNHKARATLEWGETAEYGQKKDFDTLERLHKFAIEGLRSNTPYFYRITATDHQGNTTDSGALTFRTAPVAGDPVNFVVVGDTEARPHINDRLAKQIWGERPHFLMLVGDLTDGGQANNRWQWTHEFFTSMRQLTERVPVLAAPGNGESDLVWYNHYHNLPGEQSYYNHRIGDVEFFMLDSNMGHHDANRPGFREKQRRWLEQVLKRSTARWKVAGHHHPTYSSDENDYGNSYTEKSENGDSRVRDDFLELYEKYGVDVVFFGHLHSYERTWPVLDGKVDKRGVVYIQTGGGGGNHEEGGPTRNWFTNRLYSGYHYTNVNVFENTMSISIVDTEGRQRDTFKIEK